MTATQATKAVDDACKAAVVELGEESLMVQKVLTRAYARIEACADLGYTSTDLKTYDIWGFDKPFGVKHKAVFEAAAGQLRKAGYIVKVRKFAYTDFCIEISWPKPKAKKSWFRKDSN